MAQIRVRVGILGLSMSFDPSGPSEWGCLAKSHGTHILVQIIVGKYSFKFF